MESKRVQIITALIALLIASYFVSIIWFCTSENGTLQSIGEWMLLIPMIAVIAGMIAALSCMITISITENRKENKSMCQSQHPMEQRCRKRDTPISRITIHCHSKFGSERMIKVLEDLHPYTSFNYLIDKDGTVTEVVPEKYGSWSTGSPENDNAAINILCSLHRNTLPDDHNSNKPMQDPYYLTETVFNALIDLCTTIVAKYGYKQLLWKADGNYLNAPDDAITITMHKLVNPYGKGQGCVPEFVEARFGELASRVTEKLK